MAIVQAGQVRPLTALVALAAFLSPSARSEQPSPAEVLEHRVSTPLAVGIRQRETGVETAAPLQMPSIVKARDGRWLMIGGGQVCSSADGGKTWGRPETLSAKMRFAIRLKSGKLGGPAADGFFHTSADDGKTWQKGGKMAAGDVPASPYEAGGSALLIQAKSGRLLMPVRFTKGAGHMGLYGAAGAWGILNGKLRSIEGHAHWPEPDITHVLYSDDEGRTWARSEGGIMIWRQDGYGGMWPCDEPTIVEVKNGDVVLFLRTSLGRVYTARSGPADHVGRDGKHVRFLAGHRFDLPKPTALAASYSPCTVRRIPRTGDLLLVWNQVSGDEIRAGYRRGRLSSAISKDDGETWQHFRTIDRLVLPPAGRVAPDKEPRMARGLDYVGVLPEDYGAVDYPTVEFADDTVFLFYWRALVKPRPGDVSGRRMWAVPLSWFYRDEPALPPAPKLVLQTPAGDGKSWNANVVPADYYEGRFYVRLSDLAKHLKSPIGRLGHDLYAPLHQVITCLGWTPHYDRSQLNNAKEPQLVVYCMHPHAEGPPLPALKKAEGPPLPSTTGAPAGK